MPWKHCSNLHARMSLRAFCLTPFSSSFRTRKRVIIYGPQREKTCLLGFANNKGQSSLRSLICAFVIRLLKSIISRLATSEISLLYLVSVVEETGLSLALLETPKTGFLTSRPIYGCLSIVPRHQYVQR